MGSPMRTVEYLWLAEPASRSSKASDIALPQISLRSPGPPAVDVLLKKEFELAGNASNAAIREDTSRCSDKISTNAPNSSGPSQQLATYLPQHDHVIRKHYDAP